MFKKAIFLLAAAALLLAPAAMAQDDVPRVAIISYGLGSVYAFTEAGIYDTLTSYGYFEPLDIPTGLSSEDRLKGKRSLLFQDGMGIEGIRADIPNFDLATLSLQVEHALDEDPDVIIAISAPIAQAVLNVTQTMDEPPLVIFAGVQNPYEAGLAQSSCIKDENVIGLAAVNPYDQIVPLILVQNPDAKKIGMLYNSSTISGIYGAEEIQVIAADLGLEVEVAAVSTLADLRAAAEGLASKGVDAIIMPDDLISRAGIQLIITAIIDDQIPLFYAGPDAIAFGATISAGFDRYYPQGGAAGVLLAAYLNGELDPATTGIVEQTGDSVYGINTVVAEMQEIEIPQVMIEKVDILWTLQDGVEVRHFLNEFLDAELQSIFLPPTLEERREADAAFLASAVCTDEMIAEQQAELDG